MSKFKQRQRGLSLVELMVAILIFTAVMMTFAMVFPSGYRLSLKSRNENRAAQLAQGLLNKMMTIEFSDNAIFSTNANVPTLAKLAGFTPNSDTYKQFNSFIGVDNEGFFLDGRGERTEFFIPEGGLSIRYGVGTPYNPGEAVDDSYATISVTVAWIETQRDASTNTRRVTLQATRSNSIAKPKAVNAD